jgi:PhoH-like ATPase
MAQPDPRTSTRRSVVLDTSVLLDNPAALFDYPESDIVLPITVVTELDNKKSDVRLGYAARKATDFIDELEDREGDLSVPVPLGSGSTLRIEVESDFQALPRTLREDVNDTRILAVAAALHRQGTPVVLVSKDRGMRLKARALAIPVQAYASVSVSPQDTEWSGIETVEIPDEVLERVVAREDVRDVEALTRLTVNTGVELVAPGGTLLGRVDGRGSLHLVDFDDTVELQSREQVFGVPLRNREQALAMELLRDKTVGIVSLGGQAGTGKSALALLAGLEAVLEKNQHHKIVVFRPLEPVGGRSTGYLPGGLDEKMQPWQQAIYDAVGPLVSEEVIREVGERDLLEIASLEHVRGRTLHGAFVVVDEAVRARVSSSPMTSTRSTTPTSASATASRPSSADSREIPTSATSPSSSRSVGRWPTPSTAGCPTARRSTCAPTPPGRRVPGRCPPSCSRVPRQARLPAAPRRGGTTSPAGAAQAGRAGAASPPWSAGPARAATAEVEQPDLERRQAVDPATTDARRHSSGSSYSSQRIRGSRRNHDSCRRAKRRVSRTVSSRA